MAKALQAGEEERRLIMARFWQSALGFWRGAGSATAWALTAALVAVVLAQIAIQYELTVWNRNFFDALERRDGSTVLSQCLVLLALVATSVGLGIASVAGRFYTHIRWRRHLSNGLLDHWFWNGRYYRLNMMRGDHDNPELRIADDARLATDAPIDFAVGLLSAAVGAITFITVLWRVGGGIEIGGWTIPGYLVVTAVLYSAVATGAMLVVGRRFVAVAERKNAIEADFRYCAVRLRENGESIALLEGEKEEREALGRLLDRIRSAWWALGGQHMRTTSVSQTNTLLAPTVPLLLCAPKYLAGTMSSATSCRPRPLSWPCRPPSTGWSTTIRDWPTGRHRPCASARSCARSTSSSTTRPPAPSARSSTPGATATTSRTRRHCG